MPKIIGLTGGIGSGKTTVARMFAQLGVPVYIADEAGRKMLESEMARQPLLETFGPTIFADGKPDRARIAGIVFKDSEKLAQLNAIVHPLVANDFRQWLSQHPQANYIIREAAILFESGSYRDCDFVITVSAPLEQRIARVVQRDNTTREAVMQRIAAQWTDAQREAQSDFIIHNEQPEKNQQEVVKIHDFLTNLQ